MISYAARENAVSNYNLHATTLRHRLLPRHCKVCSPSEPCTMVGKPMSSVRGNTLSHLSATTLYGGRGATPRRPVLQTPASSPDYATSTPSTLKGEGGTPSWKVRRGHVGISSELKVLKVLKVLSRTSRDYETSNSLIGGVHSLLVKCRGTVSGYLASCERC